MRIQNKLIEEFSGFWMMKLIYCKDIFTIKPPPGPFWPTLCIKGLQLCVCERTYELWRELHQRVDGALTAFLMPAPLKKYIYH